MSTVSLGKRAGRCERERERERERVEDSTGVGSHKFLDARPAAPRGAASVNMGSMEQLTKALKLLHSEKGCLADV